MNVEETLFQFLKKFYRLDKPILLGLSGGPDSLTLLYLLLKFKQEFSLKVGLAHVDHGWRSESAEEARKLANLAERLDLPFHLKKLNPEDLQGNLEAACRMERIQFFGQLCEDYSYQAVLLAHHADDYAETVLKRILEGCSLPYLSGLQEECSVHGVRIWRPFLTIPKKQILDWLSFHEIISFEDKTNLDPRYLRGKFRSQILPELSKNFGKEIGETLCRIGREGRELADYLDKNLKEYLGGFEKGSLGTLLDFQKKRPETSFEIRYLIRRLCESEGCFLSHHLNQKVAQLVQSGKAHLRICVKSHIIFIDRHRLFLTKASFPLFEKPLPLKTGTYSLGGWSFHLEIIDPLPSSFTASGWKEAWKGELRGVIPKGEGFYLGKVKLNSSYPGKAPISKWFTDHKVPAFLRKQIPVIWHNDQIICEFLTLKNKHKETKLSPKWGIRFQFTPNTLSL